MASVPSTLDRIKQELRPFLPDSSIESAPTTTTAPGASPWPSPNPCSNPECLKCPIKCPWAETYYRQKRKQGIAHAAALRCLGMRWLKILWNTWTDRTPTTATGICATR
jgi:hypothetical protein